MDIDFLKKQWNFLQPQSIEKIKQETLTSHHAVQFIAMAGKYLVEEQYDDSHTAMEWFPDLSTYFGNWINGKKLCRVGFNQNECKLVVVNNEFSVIHEYPLEGKTKQDAFEWLIMALSDFVKNIDQLKKELHYGIPPHPTDHGQPFQFSDPKIRQTLSSYRSNAQWLITFYSKNHAASHTTRVWPHHFDTGCLIPVHFTIDNFPIKTLSLGMAIPDEMVNDYYFYVSTWKKDGEIEYSDLSELKQGKWITEEWKGAVLPLHEIARLSSEEEQFNATVDFLETTIRTSLKLLK